MVYTFKPSVEEDKILTFKVNVKIRLNMNFNLTMFLMMVLLIIVGTYWHEWSNVFPFTFWKLVKRKRFIITRLKGYWLPQIRIQIYIWLGKWSRKSYFKGRHPHLTFQIRKKIFQVIVLNLSIFFIFWSFYLWLKLSLSNVDILYFDAYFNLFECAFGVDKTSILFIFLTNFLIFICIILSLFQVYKLHVDYLIYLLVIQVFLTLFFCTYDLILFYICFEGVLIPMYLIIGTWGSRERRLHANYQFFLYTLCGSIFMLMSILLVHVATGTTNILVLMNYKWYTFYGPYSLIQLIIWIGFFIGFAIKVPMLPFHLWLPEAHVEAPTGGSVLLAGLLLKLGGYGFVKVLLLVLPFSNFYFVFSVSICALAGLVYGSFTTVRQNDLKKIIAYTSVAHMNLVILGLFTNSSLAIYGSLFLMLSHGLVSSALFASIGMIYDRMHTRIVMYYSGLAMVMPLFAVYFFILSIANFGFPGTSSFIGEFFIFMGIFKSGQVVLPMIAGIGFIISAFYSMWLYNRLCFGMPRKHIANTRYIDLMKLENYVLAIFVGLIVLFGFYLVDMSTSVVLFELSAEQLKLYQTEYDIRFGDDCTRSLRYVLDDGRKVSSIGRPGGICWIDPTVPYSPFIHPVEKIINYGDTILPGLGLSSVIIIYAPAAVVMGTYAVTGLSYSPIIGYLVFIVVFGIG